MKYQKGALWQRVPHNSFKNPTITKSGHTFKNPTTTQSGHTFKNPTITKSGHTFRDPKITKSGHTFKKPTITKSMRTFKNPTITHSGHTFRDPTITKSGHTWVAYAAVRSALICSGRLSRGLRRGGCSWMRRIRDLVLEAGGHCAWGAARAGRGSEWWR